MFIHERWLADCSLVLNLSIYLHNLIKSITKSVVSPTQLSANSPFLWSSAPGWTCLQDPSWESHCCPTVTCKNCRSLPMDTSDDLIYIKMTHLFIVHGTCLILCYWIVSNALVHTAKWEEHVMPFCPREIFWRCTSLSGPRHEMLPVYKMSMCLCLQTIAAFVQFRCSCSGDQLVCCILTGPLWLARCNLAMPLPSLLLSGHRTQSIRFREENASTYTCSRCLNSC